MRCERSIGWRTARCHCDIEPVTILRTIATAPTNGIRPATRLDIPAIAALYARVYPGRCGPSLESRSAYLRHLLMEHPWQSEDLPSLAFEDRTGRVVGFLGVMPRRMLMNGRPIVMAVSHHFMVDPEHRATLAGVNLLRAFFAGRQDLSMCETNDQVRKIWVALGGTTALLPSLQWTRPLRPAGYFVARLRNHHLPSPVAASLFPVSWILDKLADTIRHSPYRLVPSDHVAEPIDADALLHCIQTFARPCALQPRYDLTSLAWLQDVLASKWSLGELRTNIVRRRSGEVLGYYSYYLNAGGVSEVVHMGGQRGAVGDVMEALARDAHARGAVALAGRLDPRCASDPAATKAMTFKYTGNWLLVHTRDAEIERALHAGDAWLTRLEGEWWMPFVT
jgi:hypothetical protein